MTVVGPATVVSLRTDTCQPTGGWSGPSVRVSVREFGSGNAGAEPVTVILNMFVFATPPPTVAAPPGHRAVATPKLPGAANGEPVTTVEVRLPAVAEHTTATLN